jgi:hypothetical protein
MKRGFSDRLSAKAQEAGSAAERDAGSIGPLGAVTMAYLRRIVKAVHIVQAIHRARN